MKFRYLIGIAALLSSAFVPALAFAADLPSKKGPPVAPAVPDWWSTFTVSGVVDAGITGNGDVHTGTDNFGRLFDDKAGRPLLNQVTITATRPFDPTSKDVDFGFKVQLMLGSDARYTHFLGECDYCLSGINQFDVVEAWGGVHLPYVFGGGIDVKVGQFPTLEGIEVINAPDNLFYSHSYIFNFGLPLKDTGVMTISHVTPIVDIYAGVVTGVNTSIGRPGDNNSAIGFEGGIGLNLLDGNLTILATTNIGPQNPNTVLGATLCNCSPNSTMRYLNDIAITYKATDKLTFLGELNYIHDDGFLPGGVDAYGAAGYVSYAFNDWLKINGRAEVYRDNNGVFVAAFPGNFDFVNGEHGYINTSFGAPAPTTYLGLTAGLNITPTLPKEVPIIKSLTFRPEVRYDTSLNNTTPYAGQTKSNSFTFGGDVIAKF